MIDNLSAASLVLYDVLERGVPNRERVPILVRAAVDISSYALAVGLATDADHAIPLRDNFLWFGNAVLSPGDWLMVYTAAGESRVDALPNSSAKLYSVHWAKSETLFHNRELVPMLFRLGDLAIGNPGPAPSYPQVAAR